MPMDHQQHPFSLVTAAVTPPKPSTSSREWGETYRESVTRGPLSRRGPQHFKLMLHGGAC